MLTPPEYRRLQGMLYRLAATECIACERVFIPARIVCVSCGESDMRDRELSGLGSVVGFTTMIRPPDTHELFAPYVLGLVQLVEGPRLLARLVDYDNWKIGDPVEMVTRRLYPPSKTDLISYGYAFRLRRPGST